MTITYETLFEILRREKNHEDLQKLDEQFFAEVQKYVEDKTKIITEKPRLDQFIDGYENEQNAVRIQLQNIRKIIRDIFDRRERKIMEMAVNKAKTGSNIIDTSALLPQESAFFEEQIRIISTFRANALEPVLLSQKRPLEASQSAIKAKELNIEPSEPINKELKKVQVIEQVPKFVGIDLEIYGPFNANEEIELHPEIADMLLRTNKARLLT